jgi:hypothetical protein
MLGRGSLNLELTPIDPKIERTARENLRTTDFENLNSDLGNSIEMGGWVKNLEERLENAEASRTLMELFAPIAIDTPSCIVLPTTNTTHFDLKPHVIQVLHSFHRLENEAP